MCFSQPKMQTIDTPKRENVVDDKQDTMAATAEAEKKRQGFLTTVKTSGMGLMDAATIKKAQLGV